MGWGRGGVFLGAMMGWLWLTQVRLDLLWQHRLALAPLWRQHNLSVSTRCDRLLLNVNTEMCGTALLGRDPHWEDGAWEISEKSCIYLYLPVGVHCTVTARHLWNLNVIKCLSMLSVLRYWWMCNWKEPLSVQQTVCEHLRQLLLQVSGGLRPEICWRQIWLCR